MAPRLEFFAFRWRDHLTPVMDSRAYVATREEIPKRHDEWEIIGSVEIRGVDRGALRHASTLCCAGMTRPPELEPAIDETEAFLLAVFLRRTSPTARGAPPRRMNETALCSQKCGGGSRRSSPTTKSVFSV